MPLTSGAKLGPYDILSPLGAGGMGEVYRTHDTKLGRDVALKVLPQAFAADAERMARFQREAQVLASLNHPNIAAIYGLEESGSVRALVMELVEGPTLAELLETRNSKIEIRKPASIPPASFDFRSSSFDPLPIAKQIAEALEYAHGRGIIHRDLKPANIKLTAVAVNVDGTFSSSAPAPLFQIHGRAAISSTDLFTYDVAKDGKRFLVNRYLKPDHVQPLTVVLNAAAGVKK